MKRTMEKNIIVKRLSYIKYLFLKGEEQAKQTEIVAGFSVLALHDAVEMFLMLACEHYDSMKDNKKMMMMDYLGILPDVKMKESMKSLNECRISIKHHGQFPSKTDIEKHRINVRSFLEYHSNTWFDIDFNKLSLIDLVSFEEAKSFLCGALLKKEENDFYGSVVETRKAFNSMLHEYENSKQYWFKSIFNIGREPRNTYNDFVRKTLLEKDKDRYIAWFKDVDETVKALRYVVKLVSMGIDYRQYALFNAIVPEVWQMSDDSYSIREGESHFNERVIADKSLCDMCINFVVDCAVKLQDSDYETSSYLKSPYVKY